jgi:hypothetical protein
VTSFARLEIITFSLLACNTVYYLVAGRSSEALESVAWYALLILFFLETRNPRWAQSASARAALRALRLLATLAIAMSMALYVREKAWLDASNLLLWIAVVALLELEVWRPAAIATHRTAYTATAAVLYAGLGILVLVWLALGKWMNAWDAALWLAAFGLLEINILKKLYTKISFKNI